MPRYPDHGQTSAELAAQYVQNYIPLLPPSLRLPAYRQPDMRWVLSPHCDPAFAQLMRTTGERLDLTDRTQWSEAEARLLCAHRFLGSVALFKKGLSGAQQLMSFENANLHFLAFQTALASLIGEKLLALLGLRTVAQWFPWHDCSIGSDRSGHGWRLHCHSLLTHTTTTGHPIYYAATQPQFTLHGRQHTLAFAPQTVQRYQERMAYGTSYSDLRDAFGFVNECHVFKPARLYPHHDAVAIYRDCVPGFLTDRYPDKILAVRQPLTQYLYLLGYCPVVEEDVFWVATTLLPPGYTGTPEYGVLRDAPFPAKEKERLLAQCENFTYHRICTTMDFSLLEWFHHQGIPQVIPCPKS